MRVSILNSKTAQRVLRRGTMAYPGEVGEELDCEVDDDLTNDVASLRAVLSENVPSTSPEREKEGSECSAVAELQICLDKNLALQNLLCEKLREVEWALQENGQKLSKLDEVTAARTAMKRGILTIWRKKGDYFRNHRGQTPPSLSAPTTSRDYLGTAVYSTELTWKNRRTNKADRKLAEGVRRQIIDHLTQPMQRSLRKTKDWHDRMSLRKDIQSISKQSTQELMREDFTIDWSLLTYEQFNNMRTPIDCELRWKGHTSPCVNKGAWNKEEDKALMRLVKEQNFTNWSTIAADMKTNRTGFQCLQRYQQSLNPSMFTKAFTSEEDDRLTEAINLYGDSKWRMVAAYVGGKTPPQCMHRWNNSLRPDIKRGRWTKEEDEVLRNAVRQCGVGHWTKVASLVPGRTQSQVRERWVNYLDERISRREWTDEEDQKLKEICQKYTGPIPWATVAREMITRTDNMCLLRWQFVSDASTVVKHYTESLKQKETVMTNFYGRKGCKHTLSRDDIEEDMVPDAARQRMKSYGEKLARRKLRQVHLPVTPSIPVEAVDHVLHSYYDQIPQIPTETRDVRIFNTEADLAERSKNSSVESSTEATAGAFACHRRESDNAWLCGAVRTTQVVSIALPTDEDTSTTPPGESNLSSASVRVPSEPQVVGPITAPERREAVLPRVGTSSGVPLSGVRRSTATNQPSQNKRNSRRRTRSKPLSGTSPTPPSAKKRSSSVRTTSSSEAAVAATSRKRGQKPSSTEPSSDSSEVPFSFPTGRFLILPTQPVTSPPPPNLGGVSTVPRPIPSRQSLQGVYTQAVPVTEPPHTHACVSHSSTIHPALYWSTTSPTPTQSLSHGGTPALHQMSNSGTNNPVCGNVTTYSTPTQVSCGVTPAVLGQFDSSNRVHQNLTERSSYDIVNALINRGTPENRGANFLPLTTESRLYPTRSQPNPSSPFPSRPMHTPPPLPPQPRAGSPGNIGYCISRAMNTLVHDSCSSGDETSIPIPQSIIVANPRSPHCSVSSVCSTATLNSITAAANTVSCPTASLSSSARRRVYVTPLSAVVSQHKSLQSLTTQPPVIRTTPAMISATSSNNTATISATSSTNTATVLATSSTNIATTSLTNTAAISATSSTNTAAILREPDSPLLGVTVSPVGAVSSITSIPATTPVRLSSRPNRVSAAMLPVRQATQTAVNVSNVSESPLPCVVSHEIHTQWDQLNVASVLNEIPESGATCNCLVTPEGWVLNGESEAMILIMENPQFKGHDEEVEDSQRTQQTASGVASWNSAAGTSQNAAASPESTAQNIESTFSQQTADTSPQNTAHIPQQTADTSPQSTAHIPQTTVDTTPQSTAGTTPTQSTAGTTPQSTAGTTPTQSTAGTTPQSTAGTTPTQSTAGTTPPQSTAGTTPAQSTAGTTPAQTTAVTVWGFTESIAERIIRGRKRMVPKQGTADKTSSSELPPANSRQRCGKEAVKSTTTTHMSSDVTITHKANGGNELEVVPECVEWGGRGRGRGRGGGRKRRRCSSPFRDTAVEDAESAEAPKKRGRGRERGRPRGRRRGRGRGRERETLWKSPNSEVSEAINSSSTLSEDEEATPTACEMMARLRKRSTIQANNSATRGSQSSPKKTTTSATGSPKTSRKCPNLEAVSESSDESELERAIVQHYCNRRSRTEVGREGLGSSSESDWIEHMSETRVKRGRGRGRRRGVKTRNRIAGSVTLRPIED